MFKRDKLPPNIKMKGAQCDQMDAHIEIVSNDGSQTHHIRADTADENEIWFDDIMHQIDTANTPV